MAQKDENSARATHLTAYLQIVPFKAGAVTFVRRTNFFCTIGRNPLTQTLNPQPAEAEERGLREGSEDRKGSDRKRQALKAE